METKETIIEILEEIRPDVDFENETSLVDGNVLESFDIVLRTHDLICHNYGPTITYATIHVEFDSNIDIVLAHDEIDLIEESVKEKFGYFLTIHMDPVIIGNPEIDMIKEIVDERLKQIVSSSTFRNLIFI